jgi:hypothetical protein
MKKLLLLPLIAINLLATAQTTLIPDANFEQALIDLGYDNVIDGEVLTANIDTIASLVVQNQNISDLTGIEGFIALTYLDCWENQLTSLDVTQNTALTYLDCWENQLTSLDVTQNTALTILYCGYNYLTSLDVTQNTALTQLNCGYNYLTSLDVTQNTALTYLACYRNYTIPSLDVTQNTALTILYCGYNYLTSLDVTQNTALTELGCEANDLTSLDVTQNTALTDLVVGGNQFTSLDLSQNSALTLLYCDNSSLLNCLNLKNGNNYSITSFAAFYSPALTCIEVDDVAYSTANWTAVGGQIDAGATFSNNCNNSCSSPTCADGIQNGDETGVDCGGTICPPCGTVGIVDENVKAITLLPNPTTSSITLNNLQLGDEVSVYNTLGQRVYSSKVNAVTFSINLSELGNNGIYFVRVNNISERVLLSRGL